MILWTEAEFQRVALRTRITDRTLEACKDVLVGGATPTEAAEKHKLFISAVSRATATLKERQEQMVEGSLKFQQSNEVMRLTAIQVAKNILGQNFTIKDAEPGRVYEGPVVVNTQGYVVQKIGRTAVMYDLGRFKENPPLGVSVTIETPAHGGKVKITGPGIEKGLGKGVGR